MSSPHPTPGPAPHGGRMPMWVCLEFVMEEGDDVTHYTVEGHPSDDVDGEQFKVLPEFRGDSPMSHLDAVNLLINLRLTDVTVTATNEPCAKRRMGLRLVD